MKKGQYREQEIERDGFNIQNWVVMGDARNALTMIEAIGLLEMGGGAICRRDRERGTKGYRGRIGERRLIDSFS